MERSRNQKRLSAAQSLLFLCGKVTGWVTPGTGGEGFLFHLRLNSGSPVRALAYTKDNAGCARAFCGMCKTHRSPIPRSRSRFLFFLITSFLLLRPVNTICGVIVGTGEHKRLCSAASQPAHSERGFFALSPITHLIQRLPELILPSLHPSL